MNRALSLIRAALVRAPDPCPLDRFDHGLLDGVLHAHGHGPVDAGRLDHAALDAYIASLDAADPDALGGDGALAFWINAYNAIVLRRFGAGPVDTTVREHVVGCRRMSLDDIEHGKARRLREPRVHFALVCGSGGCPALRGEAYRPDDLAEQLEDQTRAFITGGGAVLDGSTLVLSRIFRWYAGDFAYPRRMPSLLGTLVALAHPASLVPFVARYLPEADDAERVRFAGYDWTPACRIA